MKLKNILPHIAIVLSLMLLVMFIIDRFNEAMAFINNDISKWLLCVLCVVSMIVALMYIGSQDKSR